jgi:asparagine synthase (glutamine-hydrolysing)
VSAICGAWFFDRGSSAAPACERMLAGLDAHGRDALSRLPEQPGSSSPIAFGHRLLRITAEDSFEAQPLVLDDGSWLVTDARLDNREELAAALSIPASDLPGLADSILLARAWQRWGASCLDHLAGGFALAVWEPLQQQLFLARDHSGERPLYFRRTADSVLFATTARALRACPGVSSELDTRQLARDLLGIPPEYPHTRFREISQLAPGHCLTVTTSGQTYRRYWDVDHLRPTRFRTDQDYADAFLEVFDAAVKARLRTTGSVVTELSSGLDSGAVTATAARLLAASGQSFNAYTAVPVPEFQGPVPRGCIADESRYAADVGALYPNLRHILIDVSGSDMLRELERIFPLLDLPHAAALNSVWSNLILDHARASGAKVLLAGALGNFTVSYSGADLLHGLFRRGRLLHTARSFVDLRRMGISSGRNAASITVLSLLPWSLRRRLDPLIRNMDLSWVALRSDRAQELDALDQLRRYHFTRDGLLPYLMQVQFLNNQYGDYNAASLAGWGIETRDPTADRRVFEFCASIPPEQFVAEGKSRSLLRRAMRGRLPDSTLTRTDKGIQAADYYVNLTRIRSQLLTEISLLDRSPGARNLLDLEMLRAAVEHWPADARAAAQESGIYQSALPRGLAVGTFIRRIEAERR